MTIPVPDNFDESVRNFMRQLGYASYIHPKNNQENFQRRLTGDNYPRFHIYITEKEKGRFLNLHLDQKQPSYAGGKMHSGEYEGKIVEEEAERIKNALLKTQK